MLQNTSFISSDASKGNLPTNVTGSIRSNFQRSFLGLRSAKLHSKQSSLPWPQPPFCIIQFLAPTLPSRRMPASWPWEVYWSRGGQMAGSHWDSGALSFNLINNFGLPTIESCWQHFEGSVTSDLWWRVDHSPSTRIIFLSSLPCQRRRTLRRLGKCISCQ